MHPTFHKLNLPILRFWYIGICLWTNLQIKESTDFLRIEMRFLSFEPSEKLFFPSSFFYIRSYHSLLSSVAYSAMQIGGLVLQKGLSNHSARLLYHIIAPKQHNESNRTECNILVSVERITRTTNTKDTFRS